MVQDRKTPVSQTKGAEGAWRGRGCERKKVEAEVEVEEEVIPSWEAWRITARDRVWTRRGKEEISAAGNMNSILYKVQSTPYTK